MDNDSYIFYGGGGFGGVNKANPLRTVYVHMTVPPIEPAPPTSSAIDKSSRSCAGSGTKTEDSVVLASDFYSYLSLRASLK